MAVEDAEEVAAPVLHQRLRVRILDRIVGSETETSNVKRRNRKEVYDLLTTIVAHAMLHRNKCSNRK